MERADAEKSIVEEYSHLISRSAFIFLCRVTGAGLTFITQFLLARWMGAAELGVYVLAFSWCILLATITVLGLPMASIRFIGEAITGNRPGLIQGFLHWGQNTVLAAGLSVAALSSAILYLGIVDLEQNRQSVFLAAFWALPFFTLMSFHAGVANAFSRLRLSFMPQNIFRPTLFLAAVCIAWVTGESLSAMTAMRLQLIAVVVVSVITAWFSMRYANAFFASDRREHEVPQWLRTSMPLMVLTLFSGYFPEFTVILVGSMLPSESVAVYHIAFRIALLISFALFAVDAYLGPTAAQLYAQRNMSRLQQTVNRATRLRFFGSLIAFVILALLGNDLLNMFGTEFVAGYAALLILAFGELVHAGAGPVTRLMSISGHEDKCLYVFGCCLVGAVALIAILVPPFGINGAATAAMLTIICWSLWMRQLVIRHIEIKPSIL